MVGETAHSGARIACRMETGGHRLGLVPMDDFDAGDDAIGARRQVAIERVGRPVAGNGMIEDEDGPFGGGQTGQPSHGRSYFGATAVEAPVVSPGKSVGVLRFTRTGREDEIGVPALRSVPLESKEYGNLGELTGPLDHSVLLEKNRFLGVVRQSDEIEPLGDEREVFVQELEALAVVV